MLQGVVNTDVSRTVQLEALDAIREFPAEAGLPALAQIALEHPDTDLRNEAVQWLGRGGDEEALPVLEQISFTDVSRDVQLEAVDGLRTHPGGLPSLIRLAQQHPNPEIRREATEWVGRLSGS